MKASEHKVGITAAEVALNVHKAFWAYQLTVSFSESLDEGQQILGDVLQKVEALLEDDSPQVTENDRLRLIHARATVPPPSTVSPRHPRDVYVPKVPKVPTHSWPQSFAKIDCCKIIGSQHSIRISR